MNEEVLKSYEELKRNRNIINTIEPDFFFEIVDCLLKENEILKEEKEQAWEEWNNLEQGSYGTEQKLKQQIKELRKENEELKYKIKGQECVIETQVHNEEVYESIFEKLEKENKELKKQVKSDVNTIF